MVTRPPSVLRAWVGPEDLPGRTEVQRRVAALGGRAQCDLDAPPGARWAIHLEVDGLPLRAWMEPAPRTDLRQLQTLGVLDAATCRAAEASPLSVVVAGALGDRPIEDFHRQLRALRALTPDCTLVLDENAQRPRSPAWLREAAGASTPPSPRELYSLHAIAGDAAAWIHSHGLRRCGSVEIELIDVPRSDASVFLPLAEAVAAQWIELGPPAPGEVFAPGHGLQLMWLPWEKAVAKEPPAGPGGEEDRDEHHRTDRGVLLAADRGWTGCRARPVAALHAALATCPILYVSETQTQRMRERAVERLGRLTRLHERYAGEAGWRFLVKLGYRCDGADDARHEHLWFEVHRIEGERVDATLLNAPHQVGALRVGERGEHDLGRLSDWLVIAPQGEFGPDRVGELEAALGDAR